jgi:hypothetical protein
VLPALGVRQVDEITVPQVLEVLRPIQVRGAIEAAHRLAIALQARSIWQSPLVWSSTLRPHASAR